MRTPSLPSAPVTLVGRDRERTILRERLADATGGHGGLVLIGGEAGIGKTALAAALCDEAERQGALILVGRCYDLTETPPYGPWIDLCARYLSPPALPALPPAFARRGTVGAVASQAALFAQVQEFLVAIAIHQPVVLMLDDLHWADPASLDLLRLLARDVAGVRILLVVTYRADELTRRHPLYQLLPTLVREAGAARLDLRALDAAATRALIADRYRLAASDADRLVGFVHGRAEGNALFIGELLRALEEAGTLRAVGERWQLDELRTTAVPALLRQVIDGRVARLDAESQRLLTVAAVIGQEVPLGVWAAVGEADEDAVLAAVEQGLGARLVVEVAGEERVRFAHALIREAVYESIPAIRRRRVHRRVGETLAGTGNPDPDAVAYHFQQAPDDRAGEWLVRAGERAQRAYAWLTAAERYDAALALMGDTADVGARGWLLFRFAICRRYARTDQVLPYLDEAAEAAGDAMLLARARLYQGLIRCYLGDLRRGIAEMRAGVEAQDALAAAGQAYTPLDAVDATNGRGTLALWLANAGNFAEARALGEAHLATMRPQADGADAAPYADAEFAVGIVHACLGRPGEARAHFLRAAAINRAVGHRQIVVRLMIDALHYVRLPYEADRVADRRRDAAELVAAMEGLADTVRTSERPEALQLDLLMLEGRWAEIRAIAAYLDEPGTGGLSSTSGTLGGLARAQGDEATALALVGRWLPDGPTTVPGGTFFPKAIALMRVAAALRIDARDVPQARAWLEAHDRWLDWSGAVLGRSEGQAIWAAYHRQAGNAARAYEHAERALAHATDPRQPLALLAAHRLLGELDTDAGRFDDAENHLGASLSLTDACQAPYERALTVLAMAELRAATGDTDAARTLLDEARAVCAPLGAEPALARAAALAARLDAAKESAPAYPAGLSAREVEVLRLVAQGMTNPQVAERLYLSPRTVEQHLRSIYGKLGVSTRAAATHFAVSHGLA